MSGQNLYGKNNNRFKAILLSYSRRPEKVFLVFFVVGLLALGIGVWYSRNTIREPFLVSYEDNVEQNTEDNNQALEDFAKLLTERQKDTDGDGLTDYQEINIYKTSAYLVDSDSDRISDKDEIIRGTNPNCTEGEDCSFVYTPDVGIDAEDLIPIGDGFVSPEYIASAKVILLQHGYTEADVTTMTNEETVEIYNAMLNDPNSSLNQGQQFVAGGVGVAELRALLLDNGVPEDVLQQISDEDLLNVYAQVLTESGAQAQ